MTNIKIIIMTMPVIHSTNKLDIHAVCGFVTPLDLQDSQELFHD